MTRAKTLLLGSYISAGPNAHSTFTKSIFNRFLWMYFRYVFTELKYSLYHYKNEFALTIDKANTSPLRPSLYNKQPTALLTLSCSRPPRQVSFSCGTLYCPVTVGTPPLGVAGARWVAEMVHPGIRTNFFLSQ